VRNIVIIGAVALYLLNLAGSASAVEKGRTVRDKIISSSLEVNLIGNPTTKPLVIYLPPGYDELPDQRYPVIYHLHGAIRLSGGAEKFAQAHESFVVEHGASFIDQLVAEGKTKGVILVGVDGTTKDGCSYYVNSVTNGNYADYICKELVPYVDAHYRTIARREGRGILGYSAGAFGSMYLGMTYPDLFGGIVCLSPASALAASTYFDAWAASKPQPDDGQMDELEIDLARAFWPNPDNPPNYFDWPFTRDGEFLESIYSRNADKSPELLVPQCKEKLRLTSIYLGCGTEDWAIAGARKFHEVLTEASIPHTYVEYEGGHGYKGAERKQEGVAFLVEVFQQGM
jgi:enterochelin esterase-like enzyme